MLAGEGEGGVQIATCVHASWEVRAGGCLLPLPMEGEDCSTLVPLVARINIQFSNCTLSSTGRVLPHHWQKARRGGGR
jgi:hypothetical protein